MERRTGDEMKHQGRLAIRVMRAISNASYEDLHAVNEVTESLSVTTR